MKLGIVDVGGGLRDVYGAGILEVCREKGVTFDTLIGVSAGAQNLLSFLCGQPERNYRCYTDYSGRKEYMGLENWFKHGSYINFEYIFGELSRSDGEDPIDWQALAENPSDFTIVACDAKTGLPRYFTKADMAQDSYRPMMATCCLPGINRPIEVDGGLYYDGALANPVPLHRAFDAGCDKVVLILTKPRDVRRTPHGKDTLLARVIHHEFPEASEALLKRAERYNAAVDEAKQLEAEGRVLILAPADTEGVDTLKRDVKALERLRDMGRADAEKITAFIADA